MSLEWLEEVVGNPDDPNHVFTLRGFPLELPEEEVTRVYLSPDLDHYVDVANDDILYKVGLDNPLGRHIVWVNADAKLTPGGTGQTSGASAAPQASITPVCVTNITPVCGDGPGALHVTQVPALCGPAQAAAPQASITPVCVTNVPYVCNAAAVPQVAPSLLCATNLPPCPPAGAAQMTYTPVCDALPATFAPPCHAQAAAPQASITPVCVTNVPPMCRPQHTMLGVTCGQAGAAPQASITPVCVTNVPPMCRPQHTMLGVTCGQAAAAPQGAPLTVTTTVQPTHTFHTQTLWTQPACPQGAAPQASITPVCVTNITPVCHAVLATFAPPCHVGAGAAPQASITPVCAAAYPTVGNGCNTIVTEVVDCGITAAAPQGTWTPVTCGDQRTALPPTVPGVTCGPAAAQAAVLPTLHCTWVPHTC